MLIVYSHPAMDFIYDLPKGTETRHQLLLHRSQAAKGAVVKILLRRFVKD